MRRSMKRFMTGVLSVGMIFSSFGAASAATPSDIKGHWAEERLQDWLDKGYIKGYPNGTVQPDRTVTRAEFVAMINRVLGYTEMATVNFKDMSSAKWAAEDIAKAVKAGYIQGYGNQTFRPNAKISREETAMILARIMELSPKSTPLNFKDAKQVAPWAKGSVAAVVDQKLMGGYSNGTFGPKRPLKRAESVAVIHRISMTKAPEMGAVYDKPGTYGGTTGTETVRGGVTVSTSGVTLQNMVIEGDLILGPGIGEGDVILNNVTVKGKTYVYGGGSKSVTLNNTILGDMVVDKEKGSVRIVAGGSTQVQHTVLESPAILQETNLSGTGFVNVTLPQGMSAGQVELSGAFNQVSVSAPNAQLALTSGTIQSLTVHTTATNANIRLDQGTTVVKLVLYAVANVTGKGTIQTAAISEAAKATKFETAPLATENAPALPPGGGSGGGETDKISPTVATYDVYEKDIGTTTATVYLSSSEAGTAHYVVLNDGAAPPTKEEVAAGKASGNTPVVAHGQISIAANRNESFEIKNLTANKPYVVYLVARDNSGNISDVKELKFKTKPTTQ